MREDRGVIARAGSDMHHVFTGDGPGLMHQMRVQRWLPVVEAALWHQRDQTVGVEVNWIGIRRRRIVAHPAHHPRSEADKVLAGNRSEGLSEARIVDAGNSQDLFGVGRANNTEFGLPVHFSVTSTKCVN